MTYDSLLQWGVPLFVCLVGCVCLWQSERLVHEASVARVRNEQMIRLFLEAMLLIKLGAREEAEQCLRDALSMAGEGDQ